MNRALMNRTTVQIAMHIETDNHIIEWFLATLSMLLWRVRMFGYRARYEIAGTWQDIIEAAEFTGKVFAIGFNSWAWALGVKL